MPHYRQHESDAVLESPHYIKHLKAMTAEDLHGKAEIAEELAARDIRIAELKQRLDGLLECLKNIAPVMVRVSKTSLERVAVYPADEIDVAITKVKS